MKFDHHMTNTIMTTNHESGLISSFKKGNGISELFKLKPHKVSDASQLTAKSLNYSLSR